MVVVRHLALLKEDKLGTPIASSVQMPLSKRVSSELELPQEVLLSLISESVDQVLWCIRLDLNRVIYASPAFEKIWGIPVRELYADPHAWMSAVVDEDKKMVSESWNAWIEGRSLRFETEFRIRRKDDGHIRWISDRGGVRKVLNGVTFVGGIAQDITERRKLQQERADLMVQIKNALRNRDEFVSFASHELKTPLVPLKLSLETLSSVLAGPESKLEIRRSGPSPEKLIRVAIEQLRRMEVLTNNLLDAVQLQTGNFRIQPEEINLSDFVIRVLEEHRQWIESSGSAIVEDIDPHVFGSFDPMRVEQILVNLISNAVKYANKSTIVVTLKRIDGTASLKVRDHGPGVPDSMKSVIFDRFARGSGASRVSGFGLGLYICKKISIAHGGTIAVRDAPGGGAEFELILPVREREEQAQAS
ncbi:MAG: PAS domain-containing sensor histidine kinase [Bdellovibrionales bacterium]|nr:PAS domain-containing sensor histidine kinase [Bdellovibrionales bacterium]